jgi:uncharacterized YigZ family protein
MASTARYPVPKTRARVELRVSNSRFIATIGRASSVEDAKVFLRSIREEMPDATHHVHAMRIGYGGSVIEGMSDDGEPAGTSGPPALAVLRGADLGDVILVITRYFGGTKLGTGGLVSAYGEAAKQAVAAVETVLKIERIPAIVRVPYPLYERTRQVIDSHEGILEREEFGEEVTLEVRIPEESFDEVRNEILGLSSGRAVLERHAGDERSAQSG